MYIRCATALFIALTSTAAALAGAHPVPPPGIEVPAAEKKALESGLAKLTTQIATLRGNPLLPDVEIYAKAVRYALEYNEFFKPEELFRAKELLREGEQRAAQLARGEAPWTHATGLVVRGYVSKIDKSVQPFGLVIPPRYSSAVPTRWRLDTWFHGRSETLNEINFIWDRERNPGEFTPPDTIVLHLYGRYCNANKFAGEVDLFEALDAVNRAYAIDDNRIVIRGFSMGGASTWHLAAHYPGLWAAAAPGAGFAETPRYLHIENDPVKPAWWEQKLWHLYNATDYAANFYNLPVVAYSGEIDPQRQAANMMADAMREEGLHLAQVIGPNTAHRYHPDSKPVISRAIDALAVRGRDPYPRSIRFVTWTLAYNRMKWLTVDGLGQHWSRARVDADIDAPSSVALKTSNVTALTLHFGPAACPLNIAAPVSLAIDEQRIEAPGPETDRSWTVHLALSNKRWTLVPTENDGTLRKRHGLQGPIDDAFLDSFVFVRPTGTPMFPTLANWVTSEEQRAVREWRRQFRGDAQMRDDTAITDDDIANSNLVLWGDPGSNRVLARIAARLPVHWDANGIAVGDRRYPGASHALILIYPNPLNPRRYVVLNSGFTFRERALLSNARQVPKLPDWAVVDVTTPPDEDWPGKIANAGFFGEQWELVSNR